MAQYRQHPAEIEAILFGGGFDLAWQLETKGAVKKLISFYVHKETGLPIVTINGPTRGREGDGSYNVLIEAGGPSNDIADAAADIRRYLDSALVEKGAVG
jgi:hypothetical protein